MGLRHCKERVAILSQLRVLSSKRFIRRMGKISDNQFNGLQKALIQKNCQENIDEMAEKS